MTWEPTAGAPGGHRRVPDPRFINRELSWLEFNARVLAQAEDPRAPLLERVRFAAVFGRNLDEFFQVRVAGLKDRVAAGLPASGADGRSPAEVLCAIRPRVEELVERRTRLLHGELFPALAAVGIRLSPWTGLGRLERRHLRGVFEQRIFPVLTPLSVEPGQPPPRISNLSLHLAVALRTGTGQALHPARLKVPEMLPRFLELPDGGPVVALEEVLAAHLTLLFPGFEVVAHFPFRVTRKADLTLPEHEDLRVAVEMELRRRRFRGAVRLETDPATPPWVVGPLAAELVLDAEDVYRVEAPLDPAALAWLAELDRPELKHRPRTTPPPPTLARATTGQADLFALLRRGDLLVHHPYESFSGSTEEFIRRAARDPDVLAIKQTLYRTSGDSPIVQALIRAAHAGKQVVVVVELQARFDEAANVRWARVLEDAGAHVVYGILGLKTHCKVALVVRREGDRIRRYCHVGTGNYNSTTARSFEDVGLLSADPVLGSELSHLFNFLTGYGRLNRSTRLLVAPAQLRPRLLALIGREARPGGRIVMKVNHLSDPEVIVALYGASRAGATVDLVVRTVCSLVPGVPDQSERIRVRSVVGRLLEHSRIFAFGDGTERPADLYLGSGDLMARNLDERVEAFVSVDDPALGGRLRAILEIYLDDGAFHWRLGPDGTWSRHEGWSIQDRLGDLRHLPSSPSGETAPATGTDPGVARPPATSRSPDRGRRPTSVSSGPVSSGPVGSGGSPTTPVPAGREGWRARRR